MNKDATDLKQPIHSPGHSTTHTTIPLNEDNQNSFLHVSDRDVPILIGAAVGAIGLIGLILTAVVFWCCCQYAFKRNKDVYLDNGESFNSGDEEQGPTLPVGIERSKDFNVYSGLDNILLIKPDLVNSNAFCPKLRDADFDFRSFNTQNNYTSRAPMGRRTDSFGPTQNSGKPKKQASLGDQRYLDDQNFHFEQSGI